MIRRRLIRRGSAVAAETTDDLDRTGIVAASLPVRDLSRGSGPDLRVVTELPAARHRRTQNNWWAGAVAAVALLLAGWLAGGLFGSPLGTHDPQHVADQVHLPAAPLAGSPAPPQDDASPAPKPQPNPAITPAPAPPTAEATLVPAPRPEPEAAVKPSPATQPKARSEQPSRSTQVPDLGQQLADALNQALHGAFGLPGILPG